MCLPLLFYPVYFLVANIIDSVWGDQQLINWLYFDSRSVLLKTFLSDWVSSLPAMYAIFYLLIVPVDFLSRKVLNSSILFVYVLSLVVVAGGSYFIGFRGYGLMINFIAVFFIITLYYLSKYSYCSQEIK